MSFLFALLSILNAYAVARYARIRFALTFALSFFLTGIAAASMVSMYMKTNEILQSSFFWIFLSVIALLIYLFANRLRYFWGWLFFVSILSASLIQIDIPFNKTTLMVAAIAAIILVIVFRKRIKWILIGTSSGYNLALAISLILLQISPKSAYDILGYVMLTLVYSCIAIGIYFQFKLYEKYFGQTIINESIETDS